MLPHWASGPQGTASTGCFHLRTGQGRLLRPTCEHPGFPPRAFSLRWAPVLHHPATPLVPTLALSKSCLEKRKKSQLICLEVEVTVIQHCSFYPLAYGSKGTFMSEKETVNQFGCTICKQSGEMNVSSTCTSCCPQAGLWAAGE